MRHTVKVLSYIFISSIVTSLVFAGEKKLEEELFHDLESLSPTEFDKLLLVERRQVDQKRVVEECRELLDACREYNDDLIEMIVQRLVPEYAGKNANRD